MRYRSLALFALAALAGAGCTPHVNLAARRRYYDAYMDVAGRCEAVKTQDRSVLDDLLAHTSTPNASPYPLLAVDLDTMDRHVVALRQARERLARFEVDFDRLASRQAEVSADQSAGWGAYQDLDARFQPLRGSMEASRQGFDDAHHDFLDQQRQFGITHEDVASLRKEAEGFPDKLNQAMDAMEGRLRDDQNAFEIQRSAGADRGTLHTEHQILDVMEQDLLAAETFQRRAGDSARALDAALPDSGQLYTGPGLPGNGAGVQALRDDEAELDRRRGDFEQAAQDLESTLGQTPPSQQPQMAPPQRPMATPTPAVVGIPTPWPNVPR
ncbi:MAG TPA: hypothetical protein VK842_07745 [bacterium]|jgi:hypothetical protein|nr:hypothetical protein [bacterium]